MTRSSLAILAAAAALTVAATTVVRAQAPAPVQKVPIVAVKNAPASRPKMMNQPRGRSEIALIITSTPTWMPVRTP